jgi:ABC-type iron transport system FetAB ATPase subunit
MADILFISTDYMKQNSVINDNVDDELIIPSIIKSQDLYIEPILGTDLMNRLKTDISGTSGQVAGLYKTLLDEYVQKTVREWATYEATINLNYKYTNKSVALKSSDNSTPSTIEEIIYLREQIRNTAEYYSQRITAYLCANSSLFPEYTSNNDSDDIRPNSSSYFNGLYLEGNGGCGNCNC